MAGSSATVTVLNQRRQNGHVAVQVAWVADDSDGSVPTATINFGRAVFVYMGVTQPDSGTAPTADYDIAVNDEYGCDIFGGELGDRSDTAGEQATPKIGNIYGPRLVNGDLTFSLSNNSVNSAEGTLILYAVDA